MTNQGSVVLVTGGAGFLGQHIVKLLIEKADWVKEVRVLDIRPYEDILGVANTKPVHSLIGDIRNIRDVEEAIEGVTTVIHTASLVDTRMFPDWDKLRQINVQGTKNIIQCCKTGNIQQLVYTSTQDVVISDKEIIGGTETTHPRLDRTVYKGYGDSKSQAEVLVLQANGTTTENGSKIRTVAMRPLVMYGEGDPFFISECIKTAHAIGGAMPRMGNSKALWNPAYVGNVAWAHVMAAEKLSQDTEIGGEAFFVGDDTPEMNQFDFVDLFLRRYGLRCFSFTIPYRFMFVLLFLLYIILALIRLVKTVNFNIGSETLYFFKHTLTFKQKKVEAALGYKPLYSVQEAFERSCSYYDKILKK